MKILDRLHQSQVLPRRVQRLSQLFAEVLPPDARVLDIGCGDGSLSQLIAQRRPDLEIVGIEVLVREKVQIPVRQFDGRRIPYPDSSFDAAMLVDVLHHTDDPTILLREAARVSPNVVIKDHTKDGLLAGLRLRFMDNVGNARFGVNLPYNYWSYQKWQEACRALDMDVSMWRAKLGLYPWPATYVFDASLHFLACLRQSRSTTV